MATSNMESVLARLAGLTDEQRRQLEQLFASWPSLPANGTPQEQLDYRLATRGLLQRLPIRSTGAAASWSPVPIGGPPISQTIIEERR